MNQNELEHLVQNLKYETKRSDYVERVVEMTKDQADLLETLILTEIDCMRLKIKKTDVAYTIKIYM